MARLLIDVLYHYRRERGLLLHAFTVMPNHLHVLLSIGPELSIERTAQLIKGGFSFRASRELDFRPVVWQRGYSEVRILSAPEFFTREQYIHQNTVRAGLAQTAEEYPYCSASAEFVSDASPFRSAQEAGG